MSETNPPPNSQPATAPPVSPPPMYVAPAGQPAPQPMFVQAAPPGTVPGQVMVPMAQPVQYVAGAAPGQGMVLMPQTPAVQTVDKSALPSDHFILVVILTVLCLVFNVTSLAFGVPAVLCAYFAYSEKKRGNYGSVKSYSYAGVILSFVNLAYTGIACLIIIGVTFRVHCGGSRRCVYD